MKLIWSKSHLPLSRLIMAITGEDCSHFSLVLYDGGPGEIMFESNLLGTHPAFYQTSLKSHTIVHELKIPCSQEVEDSVWDKVVEIYDGRGYDFLGAIYLGFCKLLNRFLKIPMPSINKWAKSDLFFCDEIFDALHGVPGVPQVPVANGMHTPHDVWNEIKEAI